MEKKYNNWHKKFFSGLWNEVQLKMYSEAQTLKQVKFIIDVLKLKKNCKVLDVPCGAGRISNVLAKKEFNAVGIDINPYMLKLARENNKSKNAKYFMKNMWDIDYDNEFDSAICFWGSLGYFEDDINFKYLKKVYKALKPGGKFLIDTNSVESILMKFQKRGWGKVEDIYVLEDRDYDNSSSRINVEWTFIKKAKIEVKNISMRLYSYKELTNILSGIGFKKFKAYGTMNKDQFNIYSSRLYLIAQK